MADFVAQNRFHFFFVHALQQTGGDGYQSVVFIPASGKGVGFASAENTDFRHANTGFFRQFLNRAQQPLLTGVLWLLNDLDAHGFLGHPLGNQQGNDGSHHAEYQTESQQIAQVKSLGTHVAANAEYRQGDTGHQNDGQVSGQEQNDAHHG